MGQTARSQRGSLPALLFGLRGRVAPRPYALAGFTLMALKYGVDALVILLATGRVWTPLNYLSPFYSMRQDVLGGDPGFLLELGLAAWTLPFIWIGASMSIRRAYDAGFSPWYGLLFFAPLLNYLVMLVLCAAPTAVREGEDEGPSQVRLGPGEEVVRRAQMFQAGDALIAVFLAVLLAGALLQASVHWLGSYGSALFLGSPLFVGILAGVVLNRRVEHTLGQTVSAASLAVLVIAGTFLLFALEGVLCIAMVLPLALPLAWVGAAMGRSMVLLGRRDEARVHGVAAGALCLVFWGGVEEWLAEPARYRVDSAVEVEAPPEAVWRHVVAFSELPPPSRMVFRLGIAYPVRARIEGSGVGAVRRCEFSTGAFVEPITVWDEPRRLAFDVVEQPPPMTELSPYAHLHPPHLDGYLRSTGGEFRLTPLDGGARTRLEGTTWYELDLHPAGYWRLYSDWLIHGIHHRVLEHVAGLAEAD